MQILTTKERDDLMRGLEDGECTEFVEDTYIQILEVFESYYKKPVLKKDKENIKNRIIEILLEN